VQAAALRFVCVSESTARHNTPSPNRNLVQRTRVLQCGDIAAIVGVVTAGVPRFVGHSRNTPATTRKARVIKSKIVQAFWKLARPSRRMEKRN